MPITRGIPKPKRRGRPLKVSILRIPRQITGPQLQEILREKKVLQSIAKINQEKDLGLRIPPAFSVKGESLRGFKFQENDLMPENQRIQFERDREKQRGILHTIGFDSTTEAFTPKFNHQIGKVVAILAFPEFVRKR